MKDRIRKRLEMLPYAMAYIGLVGMALGMGAALIFAMIDEASETIPIYSGHSAVGILIFAISFLIFVGAPIVWQRLENS